jgi:hypothetical protein
MADLPIFDIDEELAGFGGAPLSRKDAMKILRKRLIKPDKYHFSNVARNRLAAVMLSMLPESVWTTEVLSRVDMRQLLQPIATNEAMADKRGSLGEVEDPYSGETIDISPALQELALAEWVDLRERDRGQLIGELHARAETGGLPEGVDPDGIEIYVDELLKETERAGNNTVRAGVVPDQEAFTGNVVTDPVSGDQILVGANQEFTDFASALADIESGETKTERPAFLTQDDIALMLGIDSPDAVFGRYYDDLGNRAAFKAETGLNTPDRSQVDMYRPGPTDLRGDIGAGREKVSYTITEALHLPQSWTRDEVAKMSERMRKAGIFAQAGGEPTVDSDPADPAFKRAYKLLLAKSIELRTPVHQLLDDGALAYEDAVDEQIRTRLSDPARLRITANALTRDVLGRIATDAEQAALIETIHGFERENAIASGPEGDDEVVDVDWQARMEEMIRERNPGEAGAHDVAVQYDTFRDLLRGPGRGVTT